MYNWAYKCCSLEYRYDIGYGGRSVIDINCRYIDSIVIGRNKLFTIRAWIYHNCYTTNNKCTANLLCHWMWTNRTTQLTCDFLYSRLGPVQEVFGNIIRLFLAKVRVSLQNQNFPHLVFSHLICIWPMTVCDCHRFKVDSCNLAEREETLWCWCMEVFLFGNQICDGFQHIRPCDHLYPGPGFLRCSYRGYAVSSRSTLIETVQ